MSESVLVDVWPVDGIGSLKANADVTIIGEAGELSIRCRVIEQKDGHLWVAYPQESYEKGGERKYVQVVKPSKRLSMLVEERVLRAYEAARAGRP